MDEEYWDIDDLMEPETPNPFAKRKNMVKEGKGESFQYDVLGQFYPDGDSLGKDYQRYSKGREAHIEMMTPQKYFEEIGQNIDEFKSAGSNYEGPKANINKYKNDAMQGDKFAMPWIEYREGKYSGQEGRNRTAMAYNLGAEKIPVVVVNTDMNRFHNHVEWGEIQRREYDRKKRQNPFTFEEEFI